MNFKKGSVGNLIHGTVFCCVGKKNYGLANSLKSKIFCYPKRNETEPKELMRLDETRKFIVFFMYSTAVLRHSLNTTKYLWFSAKKSITQLMIYYHVLLLLLLPTIFYYCVFIFCQRFHKQPDGIIN